MRTLVFTIAQNGYSTAFLPCIASQKAYARKIGAEFVAVTKPHRVSDVAHSAWLKIPIMLHALEAGYDWVAYVDADCEIQDRAPDFRDEFAQADPDVFMALGKSGRVNSGVMIARGSARSIEFFRRVLDSATENISDEDRASLKYENGNVIFVNRTQGGVHVIDGVWNNSTNPELSDYIRHYTSGMRPFLKRSWWREIQYQFLKRGRSRHLSKFQSQPERRGEDFMTGLRNLEAKVREAYPPLVWPRG